MRQVTRGPPPIRSSVVSQASCGLLNHLLADQVTTVVGTVGTGGTVEGTSVGGDHGQDRHAGSAAALGTGSARGGTGAGPETADDRSSHLELASKIKSGTTDRDAPFFYRLLSPMRLRTFNLELNEGVRPRHSLRPCSARPYVVDYHDGS